VLGLLLHAMNLSKTKVVLPTPPEKGSFPLDHMAECQGALQSYMVCLKKFDGVARHCEAETKAYLQCRMDRGLMEREPLTSLGFELDEKEKDS